MSRNGSRRGALLLFALVSGCAEATDPGHLAVAEVAIEPANATVETGDQVQFQATVTGTDGSVLGNRQVFWATEDSTIARVSTTGLVTGVKVGGTRIAASSEGRHALGNVTVRAPAVATVQVAPSTATIPTGGTVQLTATLRDRNGNVLQGRSVAWTTSASGVATVSSSGRVTGVRAGSATITATSEDQSATAAVQVTAGPPARVAIESGNEQEARLGQKLPEPLVVRVTDANDIPIGGVRVDWREELGGGELDPSTSTTDAEGLASTEWTLGAKPGEQRARARVGNLPETTFRATGRAGATNLEIQPGEAQLEALRDTLRLSARVTDELGEPVTAVALNWRSLTPSIATVDANGLVDARANGSALITASAEGLADTARVRVQQVVARVVLNPAEGTLNALGYTLRFSASARDRNGHAVPGIDIDWVSLDAGIASVNGSGVVTARAPGTARVRALAAPGTADTATVLVRQVPARVEVDPEQASIRVARTVRFAAVAADSNDNEIPDPGFTWRSSNTTVATVDGSGTARGLAPGTTVISAIASSASASADLTVTLGAPASLEIVSGNNQSGPVNEPLPLPLVVRVRDLDGTPLAGIEVRWEAQQGSVDPSRSTTDADGLASTAWRLSAPPGTKRATAEVGPLRQEFIAAALPGGHGDGP